MSVPRLVLASRPSTFERVLARHGTPGQARFYLGQRGQSLDELQRLHDAQVAALAAVDQAAPRDWRRARIRREDFDRFLFQPDDVVVVVGQDGLVANIAKYLGGQPVLGVNPSPDRYDGVLVPLSVDAVADLLPAAARGSARCEQRTMLAATLDDGQRLLALNDLFVGQVSHQSARYRIRVGGESERQSSSGIVVASGTGATGWARSIHGMRGSSLPLPQPSERRLVYFVREAFPSRVTGTSVQEGQLVDAAELQVTSEMDEGGVVFGDGIEVDRLELPYGATVRVSVAESVLRLVRG